MARLICDVYGVDQKPFEGDPRYVLKQAAAKAAQAALADALAAVESGYTLDAAGVCVDDALNALYALTGESATEDVIEEVFAKFCVGK